MKHRTLGRTGLKVSSLCLGTMTFGGRGRSAVTGAVDQPGADAMVRAAIDAGVNLFDTADVYSEGLAETMLGQSLRNLGVRRADVVVATKGSGPMGAGPNDRGASRGHLMDALDASLQRLGTDHVDLYQVHSTDFDTPLDETMRALDDMVRQGKARYVGVSNWHAWRVAQGQGLAERRGYAPLASLQAYYSLAGRDLERETVPLLEDTGLGLLVWSPLAGGLLSGRFSREDQRPEGSRRASFDFPPTDKERLWRILDAARPIAEARGVSVARVSLAWLLARPFVTSAIVGAKRLEQLQDNLAAADLALGEDEIGALDEASAIDLGYPSWLFAYSRA